MTENAQGEQTKPTEKHCGHEKAKSTLFGIRYSIYSRDEPPYLYEKCWFWF